MHTTQDIEKKIVEQERYYQDKSSLLLLFVLLSSLLAVSLVGLILLLQSTAVPPPVYFSVTTQKELLASIPLNQPNIATNELLNWVAEGMMVSDTFNFVNYATVLNNASIYFTKEGYESYKNALSTAKIVEKVVESKLVLKATPMDAPQILLEKPLAGRYMWKIKIPMHFRYRNVKIDTADAIDITLIVMRVPTNQSSQGVLILKYDLEFKGRAV